jgi:L-threonylcarbamoyladenylate synthase
VDADQGGIIAIGPDATLRRSGQRVAMPNDPVVYAHHLYAVLRELDGMGLSALYIELPPDTPPWAALRDRIRRAAQPL